jgi:hypothetical protein
MTKSSEWEIPEAVQFVAFCHSLELPSRTDGWKIKWPWQMNGSVP